MEGKRGGFRYHLTPQQLEEYGKWSLERRLAWLLAANRMRRSLPRKSREIQDAFRRGEMGLSINQSTKRTKPWR